MFCTLEQVQAFFESRKRLGIKPGLSRMFKMLQFLDNPQHKLRAVHVGGTNGKGSTINYIKDALRWNNYRVGVFTSPSLNGLTGHILLNDKPIKDSEFTKLLNRMHPKIKEMDAAGDAMTEFEIITVIMFMYFAGKTDIALIEAGMGGREDTTNCFVPILSIITNIGFDHMAFLGSTLSEIAGHKAGIIKHNVPVIVGKLDKDAEAVILRESTLKGAQCYQMQKDFEMKEVKQFNTYQCFSWHCADFQKNMDIKIKMNGHHQLANAAAALMALCLLETNGYSLNWDRTCNGIFHSRLPGRFETVHEKPLVIIDGAHNLKGAEAFKQTVESLYPNMEKHLLFAGFKDKELDKMLDHLNDIFQSITLTSFAHERAIDAGELLKMVSFIDLRINENWQNALQDLLRRAQNNQAAIFVTGSLNFIGQVRQSFVTS